MIYCFSGNGNSRYVARCLAGALGEDVTEIDFSVLSSPGDHGCAGGRVIWVFPIYSWGLPLPVRNFIGRVGITGARHWMVATCGDDIGMAHRSWRRLVESRGWDPVAAFSVQMPNTYTLLPGFDVDSDRLAAKKLESAAERIDTITRRIVSGWRGDDVVKGMFPRFKTYVIYPQFMKHGVHPDRFNCDSSLCISCGKCVDACPMDNVRLVKRHPAWGDRCALCLACYHVCPVHAVNYGTATLHKGQYRLPPAP